MVVGHNGSGKSSLLRAIAGQIDISGGNINISPRKLLVDQKEFSSDLFFVTQDPLSGTADALTLVENFVVADPNPRGLTDGRTDRYSYYEELWDSFGLCSRKDQLLKYFSGGERQQIAVSIAQLRRPMLLLLDEPFSALDPQRTRICLDLVKTMHDRGTTILQVTHDTNIACTYGDRTIALEKGALHLDILGAERLLHFKE